MKINMMKIHALGNGHEGVRYTDKSWDKCKIFRQRLSAVLWKPASNHDFWKTGPHRLAALILDDARNCLILIIIKMKHSVRFSDNSFRNTQNTFLSA